MTAVVSPQIHPASEVIELDSEIRFSEVLSYDVARKVFLDFVEKEASQENLLFWESVQEYKEFSFAKYKALCKLKPKASDDTIEKVKAELVQGLREIFDTFLAPDSQYEINLAQSILNNILVCIHGRAVLAFMQHDVQTDMDSNETSNVLGVVNTQSIKRTFTPHADNCSVENLMSDDDSDMSSKISIHELAVEYEEIYKLVTAYDEAQRKIVNLMETDSYTRFRLSDTFDIAKLPILKGRKTRRRRASLYNTIQSLKPNVRFLRRSSDLDVEVKSHDSPPRVRHSFNM